MAKYPAMVRKRIIELYDQGYSTPQIADLFGVARSGVRRVRQRLRERGTLDDRPARVGRKPLMTETVATQIRTHIATHPDATREALKAALGLTVSLQSISKWLRRLDLPLKKSLHASEQDRPDVAARRAIWHEGLSGIDPDRLVFLDESGAATSLTRTRGRGPRGQRVVAKVPGGHWKIVTMISAVRTAGPFAAATIVGATDSDVFRTYVREGLAPALRPGDVVVMDNLSPHKAVGVREAIESSGATLRYLPPDSPDFNPIEQRWSKVKGRLRSIGARTVASVREAIGVALEAVTPTDCRGFFRGCGYPATRMGAQL